MKGFLAFLGAADRAVAAVLKWMTIALFLLLALIVTANILLRIFPITSLHWSDEIVEWAFAWLVFLAAAAVWAGKGHFSVGDWIGKAVKGERARNAFRLLLELIALLFAAVFFAYSLNLTVRTMEATSIFQIPKRIIYSCMPASGAVMIAYSLAFAARHAIGVANPAALEELDKEARAE